MRPKQPICPEQNSFGTNHCYYFHLSVALFIVQNLKKILQWIQNYDYAPFLGPKGPFAPNKNFSRKPDNEPCLFSLFLFFFENYYYHSHLPINPFLCAKFKKNSSSRSRVMEDVQFMGPQWPFISPNKNLFKKPVNEPYFIYSRLSTCQISKSDINLLVEY